MSERNTLRIAVRKLDAFEGALKKQSVEFSRLEKTTFNLDITPLNIQDLQHRSNLLRDFHSFSLKLSASR